MTPNLFTLRPGTFPQTTMGVEMFRDEGQKRQSILSSEVKLTTIKSV